MNEDKVDNILHERFARQADPLPGPDLADLRRRARNQAAPPRHSQPWFHPRWGLAVALALLVGSGFGFVLGSSNTPSGNAASGPVGLGFLPERGWDVLQSGTSATPKRPAISIAANVPLHPDDDADGLPYSTLLSLPSNGVVILAEFTTRENELQDPRFPTRRLPLRLRDAAPADVQFRPERPLGQYQLRAGVNGHNVDVNIYFGTPRPAPALITAAQRQLDRLVVRRAPTRDQVEERALPIRPAPLGPQATARVIDRTWVCTLQARPGAARHLDLVASPPYLDRVNDVSTPAFMGLFSGRMTAGETRVVGPFRRMYWRLTDSSNRLFVRAAPVQLSPGTALPPGVFASSRSCSATRASMPLSSRALPGPPVEFGTEAECGIRGRVLVRVRAVLQSPAAWRPLASGYAGATANVVEAALAVRGARTRKPIAFMELRPTGITRFWSSPRCV